MFLKVRISEEEHVEFEAEVFNTVQNGSLHIFKSKSSVDKPIAIFPLGGWLGVWVIPELTEKTKKDKKK